MGPLLTSFLFTAGASTWVFSKLQNRSGRNTQQSLIATGVFALVTFIIFYSLASLIM